MPDKRDMHKAKSHRNSKSAKQQAAPPRDAQPSQSPMATAIDVDGSMPAMTDQLAPDLRGKKNKSRR
jgi:hypothetical protein